MDVERSNDAAVDMLNRQSIDNAIRRAQDGMPIHDGLHRVPKTRDVHRAEHARGERQVVRRALRRLLMQKPERLLTEGKRKCGIRRRRVRPQLRKDFIASRRQRRTLLGREHAFRRPETQAVAFEPQLDAAFRQRRQQFRYAHRSERRRIHSDPSSQARAAGISVAATCADPNRPASSSVS